MLDKVKDKQEKQEKPPKVMINKADEIVTRNVEFVGLTDIMFNRYPGDNNTQLEAHQKLYLTPDGSQHIGLPSLESHVISVCP